MAFAAPDTKPLLADAAVASPEGVGGSPWRRCPRSVLAGLATVSLALAAVGAAVVHQGVRAGALRRQNTGLAGTLVAPAAPVGDLQAVLEALLHAAPKVELHTHLDGALQPETLCDLAVKNNATKLLNTSFLGNTFPVGCRSSHPLATVLPNGAEIISSHGCPQQLEPYVTSQHTNSLTEFLAPFTCISQYLQLPGAIEEMGRTFVLQQNAENTFYTEAQFAPQLLLKSCSPFVDCDASSPSVAAEIRHVTERTIDGLVSASSDKGDVFLLLDCFRNVNVSFCEQLMHVAIEMKRSDRRGTTPSGNTFRYAAPIVGINLAGDEINFPNSARPGGKESFEELFSRMEGPLREAGLGVAPHSGEPNFAASAADCDSAFGAMGASRVGHGYYCSEQRLRKLANQTGFLIEVCPASSVATGAVAGWAEHPAKKMRSLGVPMSLSTDDRAVIGTTMTAQLVLARQKLGFTLTDLVRAGTDGIAAGFAPAAFRKRACRSTRAWWRRRERDEAEMWVAAGVFEKKEVEDFRAWLYGRRQDSLQC